MEEVILVERGTREKCGEGMGASAGRGLGTSADQEATSDDWNLCGDNGREGQGHTHRSRHG